MEFYKRREKFFKENFIFAWNPLKTSGILHFPLGIRQKTQEYEIFLKNMHKKSGISYILQYLYKFFRNIQYSWRIQFIPVYLYRFQKNFKE